MWGRKKNQPDANALPSIAPDEQEWSILQGTYDDGPLIVRLNSSAKQWVGHQLLGVKLGFAIPLNEPNPGGLPDPDESEQLHGVEDIIIEEVEACTKGVMAMILTTGIMREFIFYIPKGLDIGTLHDTIQSRIKSHEVQCMAVMDEEWDTYNEFASE